MSRSFYFFFLSLVVIVQLSSCGKKDNGGNSPGSPSGQTGNEPTGQSPFNNPSQFTINEISFDSSTVKSTYQGLIKKDLDLITRSNFDSDSEATTITGMNAFDSRSMAKWLTDRVRYIVGEDYAITTNNVKVVKTSNTYNPTVFADLMTGLEASVVVMSNIGSGVYSAGKSGSTIYALKINGSDIEVKSPRVGIIKVGPGLFDEERFSLSSTAANISRLGTFFHEARHSDGNGASLGFDHAKCTTGTFVGEYACENFTNGPYRVQAAMLKKFIKMCTDCTSSEKTKIQTMITDKMERLIGTTSGDPRAEKIQ